MRDKSLCNACEGGLTDYCVGAINCAGLIELDEKLVASQQKIKELEKQVDDAVDRACEYAFRAGKYYGTLVRIMKNQVHSEYCNSSQGCQESCPVRIVREAIELVPVIK